MTVSGQRTVNRRQFLVVTGAALTAPVIVPGRVLGGTRGAAPSQRMAVGVTEGVVIGVFVKLPPEAVRIKRLLLSFATVIYEVRNARLSTTGWMRITPRIPIGKF